MRKLVSLGLIAFTSCLLTTNVLAKPADGQCDALKSKEYTKGLFGLCVAFHNAGEDRGMILDKYNAKKQPGDLDMPMEGECTCWSVDQLAAAEKPMGCFINDSGTGWDGIIYSNAQFLVGKLMPGGLDYCSVNLEVDPVSIGSAVAAQCAVDIEYLAGSYDGLECYGT